MLVGLITSACGRVGFDSVKAFDGARSDDTKDIGSSVDASFAPSNLACGEDRSLGGGVVTGSGMDAIVTSRGIAVVWLDPAGTPRGSSISIDGTIALGANGLALGAGPATVVSVAADAARLVVATGLKSGAAETIPTDLDFAPTGAAQPVTNLTLLGRSTISRKYGGGGFVVVGSSPTTVQTLNDDASSSGAAIVLTGVAGSAPAAASVVETDLGYRVINDDSGLPNALCIGSDLDPTFNVLATGSVGQTAQADCYDTVIDRGQGLVTSAEISHDPASDSVEYLAGSALTLGSGGVTNKREPRGAAIDSTLSAAVYVDDGGTWIGHAGNATRLGGIAPIAIVARSGELLVVRGGATLMISRFCL